MTTKLNEDSTAPVLNAAQYILQEQNAGRVQHIGFCRVCDTWNRTEDADCVACGNIAEPLELFVDMLREFNVDTMVRIAKDEGLKRIAQVDEVESDPTKDLPEGLEIREEPKGKSHADEKWYDVFVNGNWMGKIWYNINRPDIYTTLNKKGQYTSIILDYFEACVAESTS